MINRKPHCIPDWNEKYIHSGTSLGPAVRDRVAGDRDHNFPVVGISDAAAATVPGVPRKAIQSLFCDQPQTERETHCFLSVNPRLPEVAASAPLERILIDREGISGRVQ